MSDLARRVAAPPSPTHLAAQRLLEWAREFDMWADYRRPSTADVRLVAEAVMTIEAHPAKTAGMCASGEACCCCGSRYESRDANDPWEGRLDGYCYECALARCDAYPGECPVKTAMSDLARRGAALQAEVVRLREALEVACDELSRDYYSQETPEEAERRILGRVDAADAAACCAEGGRMSGDGGQPSAGAARAAHTFLTLSGGPTSVPVKRGENVVHEGDPFIVDRVMEFRLGGWVASAVPAHLWPRLVSSAPAEQVPPGAVLRGD